jgi:hypothetical protein
MGGVAGHMFHPFDVCESGRELIDLYENEIPKYLAKNLLSSDEDNELTLKLDGINSSFRIVKDGNEFKPVIDRGAIEHDVLGKKNELTYNNRSGIHFQNTHDEHTRFLGDDGKIRLTPHTVYRRLFTILREAFTNQVVKDILGTKEIGLVNYIKKHHYTNVSGHSQSHILHTFDSAHLNDEPHVKEHAEEINIAHALPGRKHSIFNVEAIHPYLKNIVDYTESDVKKVVQKTFDLNKGFFEDTDKQKISGILTDSDKNKEPFMFFVINGIIEKDYVNAQQDLMESDPNFKPNILKMVVKNMGHRSIKEIEKDVFFQLLLKTLNKHALKHRCAFITRIKVKSTISHSGPKSQVQPKVLPQFQNILDIDANILRVDNKGDIDNLENDLKDIVRTELNKTYLICNTRKTLRAFLEDVDNIKKLKTGKVKIKGFIEKDPNEIKEVNYLNKKTLYDFIINKKNGHVDLNEHVEIDGSTDPNIKLSEKSLKKILEANKKIINGCALWLSTKKIGDALLRTMKTDTMGLLHQDSGGTVHEGIVLDNLKGDHKPIKITGNFIDRFDESAYEKK